MKFKPLLCLALILGVGLFGCSTNAPNPPAGQRAAITSPWGSTESGLRCRLILPESIEQGMSVPATVELQADPAQLPAGIRKLNTFMRDTFLTLTLTDARTGKQFAIMPCSYGGPPIGYSGRDSLVLNQPLKPWKINFPLVTVYSNLAPADYVCHVTFSYPTNPPSWVRGGAAFDPSWWHGTILSGNVHLQVLRERPKFQTFWIPKRLVVTKELTNLHSPDQPPLLAASL